MISDAAFYIVTVSLIAVIIIQEIRHERERKDLYNRIMAGSLKDYKESMEEKRVSPPGNFMKNKILKNNPFDR